MRTSLLLFASIFMLAFPVNFLWESVQVFAYGCAQLPAVTVVAQHLSATLGDGSLTLVIYGAGSLVRRTAWWIASPRPSEVATILLTGAVLAVAIEWFALRTGRWSYSPAMPVIPRGGVGWLPVAQLVVLPFPVFWTASRLVRGPSEARIA